MKTPIIDFVRDYKEGKDIRFHMPGHKGISYLGFEDKDITEIDGADYLFHSTGIIKESEENSSKLFGFTNFYSTEGSSLAIRAMLYLALTYKKNEHRPYVMATRNAHKTFITSSILLDFDIDWIYGKNNYLSSNVDANTIEERLKNAKYLPFAIYLTSPDYLGNILDIKSISEVCKKYGVLLLVDNAHGAYLKFLNESLHPIDLGASLCASSAHKSLPCLTGGAYLSISNELDPYFKDFAKNALSLFASTSPSYLILESLDYVNLYLEENKDKYPLFIENINKIKEELRNNGYTLIGSEGMKITIDAKKYGYTGNELNTYLKNKNIIVEFYDDDYVVLMPSMSNSLDELNTLKDVLLKLNKKPKIEKVIFSFNKKEVIMSIRCASFSKKRKVNVDDSLGLVLASTSVTCPPAVPILVCGEKIDQEAIDMFKYYGIDEVVVVDNK